MQNRYVGDVGDYVKLAILRELGVARRLGVAWWLVPDERHNGDGRHVGYLNRPSEWRQFDDRVFDALKRIVNEKRRTVHALEAASLLPEAVFASEAVPCDVRPFGARAGERQRWFERAKARLHAADLVFVDPDNGIASPGLKLTRRSAGKSILVSEICALRRPGRALVVYHHQTRWRGGHIDELRHLAGRLTEAECHVSGALRASPWSPRAFFLIDGDQELADRCMCIEKRWRGRITWHPDVAVPRGSTRGTYDR